MPIWLSKPRELEREHQALLSSTSWRITEPLRKLEHNHKTMFGQRNQVRRALKAAWWAVTPWRIPARLRFIRERNASSTVGGAATTLSAVQSPYLAWARGRATVLSAIAFPRSEKPPISFLLDAGAQSDDVALGRTLASLRGQNRTVWEVVIYGASTYTAGSALVCRAPRGQTDHCRRWREGDLRRPRLRAA